MKFGFVCGRACLNFAGTLKHRLTVPEERLTTPELLSEWAVQAGLVDAGIEVSDEDLVTAIEVREAIYRTATARLDGIEPRPADVDLLNAQASHPQLAPRLLPDGTTRREGTAPQLLASLAADLLGLLAGPDIDNVKRCDHPNCSLLYVDSSRAKNRHWCGMATCGNKVKVQAFRARQRASAN
ncbi:CGNR zinc finger domain-containing protein [Mycobacterium sp. Aquia_213]|uniref:CGNR zinc finger domain-containing protein n=1 Tax=Mycobacterium sp. Aquia_213 TaxID=2991728 RepID=UPI00226F857B|nr:ABATE domain-containing protein [Mycobacterium sp. Aquia_213]WAC94018.1 ABATE domain-containing protein [Mycobacterium sp. Aquia_213]